jgi:hypothetical protein
MFVLIYILEEIKKPGMPGFLSTKEELLLTLVN